MRKNDAQLGRPGVLYRATKSQIEAISSPQVGMIAFATDTNQLGVYTANGWNWNSVGALGDMLKSVYDADNDGIVDSAESVDWSGVQNKPEAFPPSQHTHLLSDISDHDKSAHDALGIDADTVDGKHASDFANAVHDHDDRYYTEAEIDTMLQNVGTGDMLKSVYDTDNDGVVDAAEAVDWSGVQNKPTSFPPSAHTHPLSDVTGHDKAAHDALGIDADTLDSKHAADFANAVHSHDDRYYTETELNTSGAGGAVHWDNVTSKPSTYPPSTHQHAASDVTSGVFDAARIPNLDASKIATGTLSTDRFSAYADLQAENYFGFGSTQIARNVERAVGIRAVRNTSQSIPNATWTRIVLNTLISESKPSSMSSQWDSANGHFVVRQSGWYALFGAATFENNANGYRFVGIAKNNSVTNTLVNSGVMALSGIVSCVAVSTIAYLASGDTVSLWATQNSGGNLNVVYQYENWTYLAMVLLFPS